MAAEQADLPAAARRALSLPADPLVATRRRIDDLTADIRAEARGRCGRAAPAPMSRARERTAGSFSRRLPGNRPDHRPRAPSRRGRDDWPWQIISRKKPEADRDRPGQPHGAQGPLRR
jgi:hypothetical protein